MSDLPPLLAPPPPAPPLIHPGRSDGVTGPEGGLAGPPSPPARPERQLSAGPATNLLLVFLGVQFGAAVFVGLVAGIIIGVARGIHHTTTPVAREIAAMTPTLTALATLFAMIASGVAMVAMAAALFRNRLTDRSPTGAAWVYGRSRENLRGLGIGVLVGLCYALGNILFQSVGARPPLEPTVGPLARLAITPGLPQLAWFVMALLLAPPIEELLFRGVLYGGYRRSWGAPAAAALTTAIFVVLHLTEIVYYLPAALGIASLALAAMWFRLRSAAIGPAIAVHFGYNLVIVLAAISYTWR